MALVMLPCDLPWWENVKKYLNKIAVTKNTLELIDGMQKIHELCNVGLDPDEDKTEPDQFVGLLNFLDNDLTTEERSNFLNKTLPSIVSRALKLREFKPLGGLHFSLQQQPDCTELEYSFIASLIANAFFSTFPKRTDKTHPTLKDFNFSNFFKCLHLNIQKSKLRSILYYFDWLENNGNSTGHLKIMRQVMSGKEWLTIEDWLECNLPLCSVQIKHDGSLGRAEANTLQICFASSKIGGNVLNDGNSQECINAVTFPEIMSILLNVEALEDNEVLTVENVTHLTRIVDPKYRANFEKLECPYKTSICCMDADDYTKLPIGQYEEDNVLRELNKCLLAFQQKQTINNENSLNNQQTPNPHRHRRLSPIGESIGSYKSDKIAKVPLVNQQSCSTTRSGSPLLPINNNISNANLRIKLDIDRNLQNKGLKNNENLVHNRRGRFIVLGSSGECLPVTRYPLETTRSIYSSCESSEEEFHSAKTSLEGASDDENYHKRYSIDLGTLERRQSFAKRLKDDLRKDSPISTSSSADSSFAVGISVTGSGLADPEIRVRRGGSTGFALHEESLDEEFLRNSLQQERQWIDNFKNKYPGIIKKSNKSSEYSCSTEYSSELEEMYEQFSKWLDHPILETEKGTNKELEGRELAVVRFAGSLLKRTLSESFAGVTVPLTEEPESTSNFKDTYFNTDKKNKLVLNAKSLSLELARQKHKLAAQLIEVREPLIEDISALTNEVGTDKFHNKLINKKNRRAWFISCVNEAIVQNLEDVTINFSLSKNEQLSQIAQPTANGLKPIATGNWGCGSSRKGDVQLKVIIQWLAASVAGVPYLVYYTCGHQQLTKLDTVCRILVDRKWCVKDLAQAILRYSNQVLHGREISGNLFQELITSDRSTQ